ncbi:MAG: methionine--tRNA ligase [candidate division WOR-3 bacterium]
MDSSKKAKVIVTGALPYANGPIHIGHFAGVYLPADIYTRFLKKKGKDVIYICGTDENGVPITIAAEKEGISPKELVTRYHNIIKDSLEKLGVKFENFSGTSRKIHYEFSQKVFLELYQKGYIEPKDSREFYCERCERFLPDRYVEGICPHCGYEEARGDSCDSCGSWLEADHLIEPRCKLCGATPVKKETKHWYLLLDKFQGDLEKWIEGKNWKKTVKSYLKGWLKEGLKPRAITRDLEWGVPVPLPDVPKNKVLYVWFDAPLGYISSTIEWAEKKGEPEKWKEYWQDPETVLVHFIGKDNIVFHGIIWPAIIMGLGNFILPSEIPANEYLNLEGAKVSTSRNIAVWLHEYLKDFPPDFLRYYLCCIMPETKDSEFKWKEFQERVNQELINNFGNFVNRTLKFIEKYYDGKIPEIGELSKEDKKILGEVNYVIDKIDKALSEFHFRNAIKLWMEISSIGNRYYDKMKPWETMKTSKERTNTTIYLCTHLIHILATIGELFVPFSAEKVLTMLNLKEKEWERLKEIEVPGGHKIKGIKPLFRKIEDSEIEKQFKGEKEMSYITIEDFKKIELKIGIIEKVEEIEGSNKLYKLIVDTGEKRTIVAGIKQYYKKEELLNKKIVVATNLKPATIMGVKSEGMLLAADDGKILSILSPDKEINPGAKIS